MESPQVIECPLCGVGTDSLKACELTRVVHLLVYVGWWHYPCVACPNCMRAEIVRNSLINLLTANVGWPLLFPFDVAAYLGTRRPGHAQSVQEAIKEPAPSNATDEVAVLALSGAALGAFSGAFFGAILGLLGGAIGTILDRDAWPMLGEQLSGEVGIGVGGFFVALLAGGRSGRLRPALFWLVPGTVLWVATRVLAARTEVGRALDGTALSWAVIGASVALPAVTRGTAVRLASDRDQEDLSAAGATASLMVPLFLATVALALVPRWWGPALAGGLGGAFVGALAGALLAFLGAKSSEAALVGAGLGAFFGGLAGFGGGAESKHLIPKQPEGPSNTGNPV